MNHEKNEDGIDATKKNEFYGQNKYGQNDLHPL